MILLMLTVYSVWPIVFLQNCVIWRGLYYLNVAITDILAHLFVIIQLKPPLHTPAFLLLLIVLALSNLQQRHTSSTVYTSNSIIIWIIWNMEFCWWRAKIAASLTTCLIRSNSNFYHNRVSFFSCSGQVIVII